MRKKQRKNSMGKCTRKKVWEKSTGKNCKAGQGLFRSRDFVTSGEKGPTRADIAELPVEHAQDTLPKMASSGHVTSSHFRLLLLTAPQIRLELCPYTTLFLLFVMLICQVTYMCLPES